MSFTALLHPWNNRVIYRLDLQETVADKTEQFPMAGTGRNNKGNAHSSPGVRFVILMLSGKKQSEKFIKELAKSI